MGSSTATENYCLRWNDFESNLSVSFKTLRDESEFFDVCLSCETGDKILRAHKLVLAASSPVFKNILRSNEDKVGNLQTIYLKGTLYRDLAYLLDFMYYGQVSLPQESLNSFLDTAKEFSIKGLTEQDGKRLSPEMEPSKKKHKVEETDDDNSSDNNNEGVVKLEIEDEQDFDDSYEYEDATEADSRSKDDQDEDDPSQFHETRLTENSNLVLDDFANDKMKGKFESEFSDEVIASIKKSGSQFVCGLCMQKTSSNKRHIADHIEAHHQGFSFVRKCPYCNRDHKTRQSLSKHVYRHHKQEHQTHRMLF